MAMKLEKLLDDGLYQAQTKLGALANEVERDAIDKFKAQSPEASLIERQNELKERKRNLEEEIRLMDNEIRDADPRITMAEVDEHDVSSYTTKSQLAGILARRKSVEEANLLAFKQIKTKFKQLINMAVGVKEQRTILGQFYAINWSGLGIELPIDVSIGDVIIEDGVITIGDRLLEAPKADVTK